MTYTNPVHPSSCPDPFVLKYAGAYWCYVTGVEPDGRAFGVRHSPDLVHWTDVGGALERLHEFLRIENSFVSHDGPLCAVGSFWG